MESKDGRRVILLLELRKTVELVAAVHLLGSFIAVGVVDVDGEAVVTRGLGVVVAKLAAHGVSDGLNWITGGVPAHLDHAVVGILLVIGQS